MTRNEAKSLIVKSLSTSEYEHIITLCDNIHNTPHSVISFDDFLNHCTVMGGNWTGMIFSGIGCLFPEVWDAIPDRQFSFNFVIAIVILCDVLIPQD